MIRAIDFAEKLSGLRQQGLPTECNCGGVGIVGFKTLEANYPIEEVEFCVCEKGQEVKAAEERKEGDKKTSGLEGLIKLAKIPTRYARHRVADWDGDDQVAAKLARRYASLGYAVATVESPPKSGNIVQSNRISLFLYSDYGFGKTSIMSAIMIERMAATGESSLFSRAADIWMEVQETYKPKATESRLDVLRRYREAPLLLIDEFGYAFEGDKMLTADKVGILTEVLTFRYDWELPTFIASNLDLPKIEALLGSRQLTDRIVQSYAIAKMTGENQRYTRI